MKKLTKITVDRPPVADFSDNDGEVIVLPGSLGSADEPSIDDPARKESLPNSSVKNNVVALRPQESRKVVQ